MRIAVWKTGHEIADTVVAALAEGLDAGIYRAGQDSIRYGDIHIGYGILRGMAETFADADRFGMPWFNCDRGFFSPGHYDGDYRISYRGTQFKWHEGIPRKPVDIKLEPMRYTSGYVLICPPTQAVCGFYGIDAMAWIDNAMQRKDAMLRLKDDPVPLHTHLQSAKAVITFNSSVGWQALQMGIPVLSDVNHSAVGSFYGCTDLSTLIENLQNKSDNRIELFEAMEAHQFKLSDTAGLWKLLSHYLSRSTSDLMEGKRLPQMSSPIASANAHNQSLASHFSSTGN